MTLFSGCVARLHIAALATVSSEALEGNLIMVLMMCDMPPWNRSDGQTFHLGNEGDGPPKKRSSIDSPSPTKSNRDHDLQ